MLNNQTKKGKENDTNECKVKVHSKGFLPFAKLMFAYNGAAAVLKTAITLLRIKTSQSIISLSCWRESCIAFRVWTIRIQNITVWIGWFKEDITLVIGLLYIFQSCHQICFSKSTMMLASISLWPLGRQTTPQIITIFSHLFQLCITCFGNSGPDHMHLLTGQNRKARLKFYFHSRKWK